MRRLNEEDGVTAVLLAILATVLVFFAAFVVDVGAMHAEVRQLQNVADAAAVAIAQDCASTGCADPNATAQSYAVANSKDLLSSTAVAIPGNAGGNSVTVTASTLEAAGGRDGSTSTLQWALAQVLVGSSELPFSRQATARWGIFGGGATIPIAICEHSWSYYTADGTDYTTYDASNPLVIVFGAPNPNSPQVDAVADCSNPSFDTYPGGFGFLDRDANCEAITSVVDETGTWYHGENGDNPVDPDSECDKAELYAMLRYLIDNAKPALIPIFDAYRGSGTGGEFRIVGYGAFQLQGFKFQGGGQGSSYQMTNQQCANNTSCLKGYYTHFVTIEEAAAAEGSHDYGGYYVGLSG